MWILVFVKKTDFMAKIGLRAYLIAGQPWELKVVQAYGTEMEVWLGSWMKHLGETHMLVLKNYLMKF